VKKLIYLFLSLFLLTSCINNQSILEQETTENKLKVTDYYKFSRDAGSMALDCHFLKGEIMEGAHKGTYLVTYSNNISGINKGDIINIFLTNSTSSLINKYKEIYNKEFPTYCLETNDYDNTTKNEFILQEILAFQIENINK